MEAVVEVVGLDSILDALDLVLDVYLTVCQTVEILELFGDLFGHVRMLKCAFFLLLNFLHPIVVLKLIG